MNAGDLRHRVTLQKRVQGFDPIGQPIEGWDDVATVWAAVEPLRGREYLAAGAMQSSVEVRIRMRYRPGITSAMRVAFDGDVYDIKAVIEVNTRREELQLMCTKQE